MGKKRLAADPNGRRGLIPYNSSVAETNPTKKVNPDNGIDAASIHPSKRLWIQGGYDRADSKTTPERYNGLGWGG